MKCNKIAKEIVSYFICLVTIWYIVETLINSTEIIPAVYQSINRCINVLIPSLFGLMVVSDLVVRTGIYQKLSLIFYPISRFLFKLPYPLFFVFLLGNLAGYPIGIKLLSQLVESNAIDKATAERMSIFCFNSGPAFVVGTIGVTVFSSLKIGVIIYISCLIANTIAGIICGIFSSYSYNLTKKKIDLSAENLVLSVQSSGKAMITVCLMVIFFASTIKLLDCLEILRFFPQNAQVFIMSILEVTNIATISNNYNFIPYITFSIATGGLCVLVQLKAMVRNNFSLIKFCLFRIPISILSGSIAYIITKYLYITEDCMENYYFSDNSSNSNIFSVICLLCMIIIIFFQKKTSNSD